MNIPKEQEKQESEYRFPYHYLDFIEGFRLVEYLDYIRFVRKLLGNIKGKRIVDAGCGDGRFCYELGNKEAEVIGVDYSEKAIGFAKAFNPDAKFFVSKLEEFRLFKRVDAIVCIETLEHIEPGKVRKVIENFHKMLDKDGLLIITVPSKNIKVGGKHYQHFSKEDLIKLMNGLFAVEKVFGHGRTSYFRRKRFNLKLAKSYIYESLGIKSYKKRLRRYYRKRLGICDTDKGKRLIVLGRNI